jgi:hypothetical protein
MSSYSDASNANIFAKKANVTFAEALKLVKEMKTEGIEIIRPEEKQGDDARDVSAKLFALPIIPETVPLMKSGQFSALFDPLVSSGSLTELVSNKMMVLRGKFVGKVQKNLLKYENIAGDGEMLAVLKDTKKIRTEEMYLLFKSVTKLIATGGTETGQFSRFKQGLLHSSKYGKWGTLKIKDDNERIDLIRSVFRFVQPKTPDDVFRTLKTDSPIFYAPNLKAAAGYPFGDQIKEEVIEEIDEELQWFFKEMSKQSYTNEELIKWDLRNSQHTTIKIKNKTEVIELAEMNTKVRNYFVFPAAIALAFSFIHDLFNAGYDSAPDNDMWAMCGFSWTNRGGDKLMKHFSSPEKWRFCFTAKVYSDDTHIAFLDEDGKIRIICADVQYLDLSLRRENIALVQNFLLQSLVNDKEEVIYDGLYENLIKYNVLKAFGSMVELPHGFITVKSEALNSGIPGTTNIGTICTVNPLVQIESDLSIAFPDGKIKHKVFEKLIISTYSKYGMQIKPGTEKSYLFDYNSAVGTKTEFKILGQHLMKVQYEKEDLWVNIPEKQSILTTLLLPTKIIRKQTKLDGSVETNGDVIWRKRIYGMQRALGAIVSGGYLHDEMYLLAKNFWNKMKELDCHITIEEMVDINAAIGCNVENYLLDLKEGVFPNQKWFMDIYLSKTKPILEVTQTTAVIVAKKPKVKGKIPATIEDIIAATKMRGVIAESLGADIVNVVEVDEVKLDLTTQTVPNKPIIPKRLTPQEKKRLRKQQRIHLGEIRIQKFQNFFKLNGYVPTKTKTKINKYKTGNTQLDSIFEDIDEIEEKCDEKANLIYQLEQQYFEQLERKTREENIDEEDIYWEDEQTELEKQIEFENNPIYSGLFTR